MKHFELCCEGQPQPLGIDEKEPRFSWRPLHPAEGYTQSAYRLWAASSPELLEQDVGDLWDSGTVESGCSVAIPYAGVALQSRQQCFWKVRVWSNHGHSDSHTASWEMGLLSPQDWQARWIGLPTAAGRALYFRRPFTVTGQVRSARVYASGLGYHELRLNGSKLGDNVLDPAWTASDKRVLYCVHDVTAALKDGANVLGAIVGNGWYGMPKLLVQMEIRYTDGRVEQILSRGGHTDSPQEWMAGTGALGKNSIYDGEAYDATAEQAGWDAPSFTTLTLKNFATAFEVDAPAGALCAQSLEPIRVTERFAPVAVSEVRPGVYVFDAGKNMAGWAALHARAQRGTRVLLRYAENINADGTINCGTLRQAKNTDSYTFSGNGMESWEPRFTYHGFRYVQVEGLAEPPASGTLTLCAVRSDMKRTGTFHCADPLLNRIEETVVRTEESNLHGIPTDCPQRNERFGWLNDMTVRTEELVYHFQAGRFLEKWCADIADTQCPHRGSITDTAPFVWGKRPADPVSASFLLIPWLCYLHYGCDRLMRRHYPHLEQWVNFLQSQCRDGILEYSSWGDWAPPEAFALEGSIGAGAVSRDTPGPLVSTAYLYYQSRLMAQIATTLGEPRLATQWEARAQATATAFHSRFWNAALGGYGSGNQACNALALYMGLVPEALRDPVVRLLADDVARNDYHLSTGNLCTKYLLEVLAENGHAETALRIAMQKSYPSWGYMIEQGATTLWERWENKTDGSMNSHNHPMLGSVSSWFFKYLAGIRARRDGPGFRQFDIRPCLLKTLKSARATTPCPYGEIESGWERNEQGWVLEVQVPANTTAHVHLPAAHPAAVRARALSNDTALEPYQAASGHVTYNIGSGRYRFQIEASC